MRVIDFFDRGALLFPERAFMIAEDGVETSYAEARDMSHRTALAMHAAGFAHNKKAAVYSPNHPGAFDALIEAQRHPDIEIALRARYLVRSLPIRWERDTDPRRVKGILSTYSEANRADRLNRMQQLAAMPDSGGIEALCRLVRFETDHLLFRNRLCDQ